LIYFWKSFISSYLLSEF